MVIFKRKNRTLDTFWDTLPRYLQEEFERNYATWNSFSGEREKMAAMDSFISELKGREQSREQQKFFEEGFKRVVDHYDSLMGRFRGEIGNSVKSIEEKVTQMEETIKDSTSTRMLEDNSSIKLPSVPEPKSQPIKISIPVTTIGPCQYNKDKGPKTCMRYVERENGTYASCTVADQLRRKQILPNFLTSVFGETGCPSNWYIRRCNYLDNKEIKIS